MALKAAALLWPLSSDSEPLPRGPRGALPGSWGVGAELSFLEPEKVSYTPEMFAPGGALSKLLSTRPSGRYPPWVSEFVPLLRLRLGPGPHDLP